MESEQLKHFADEHEQVRQAINFLAPGDEKARVTRVCDSIRKLILQATAMQDDGRDITKQLDRIETEFTKLTI